ncbi:MAG: hypothetical protein GXZ08_07170 [Tissierellia bacterium]|nr:hypothetical protein [Tissierellia bacterium]
MTGENLRACNLVWTVAENYSFIPNLDFFEIYQDDNVIFYKSAILGFGYQKLNLSGILRYIHSISLKQSNRDELVKIAELVLESSLKNELFTKRPGLKTYEKYVNRYFTDKYQFRKPKNITQEIEYSYYLLESGVFPKTNIQVYDMVSEIRSAQDIKDSVEIIELLDSIYNKYFYVNKNLNFDNEAIDEKPKDESKKNSRKKQIENFLKSDSKPMENKYQGDIEDLEKYTIQSAEFTDLSDYEEIDGSIESGIIPRLSTPNDIEINSIVEKHFGVSVLNDNELDKIEREISTGIHKDIKIHLTKGDFNNDLDSRYYQNLVKLQYEKNCAKFEEEQLKYRRSIIQLKEIIQKNIIQDLDYQEKIANSGQIIPGKIWRYNKLGDENIFKKNYKDEYGTLAFDILLDSSASQENRQSEVAIQAFIIAEALVGLNIPTRVMGFSNLFNHLILKEYRDYDDSKDKNMNIFEYYASGSNRDGLAIKYINHTMKKITAENKILIVLSDGKPNDKIELGIVGGYRIEGSNYQDNIAIKDTAKEILQTKLSGVSVLGVFTGLEEDLENEKLIYGNDFAYITNIQRFSTIIGVFIKNLIDKS